MKVLIVVDVQNDFCEGGALAVTGGAAVAEAIHGYVRENRSAYDLVVTSQDWHIADHSNDGHFAMDGADPDYVDTWPPHCLQDDHGADFHPHFLPALPLVDVQVRKGDGKPAYSAFEGVSVEHDEDLAATLEVIAAQRGFLREGTRIDIDVVGIATDYCVAATALGAVTLPRAGVVRILEHLTAAVNPQGWQEVRRAEVENAGVLVLRAG